MRGRQSEREGEQDVQPVFRRVDELDRGLRDGSPHQHAKQDAHELRAGLSPQTEGHREREQRKSQASAGEEPRRQVPDDVPHPVFRQHEQQGEPLERLDESAAISQGSWDGGRHASQPGDLPGRSP